MSMMPNATSPPDDGRIELAMAAARTERRNRPRGLVVLAAVVLAASIVFLLWVLASRAAAATSLSRANASLAVIDGVTKQLDAMERQRASPRFNPENDMVGLLQRFAGSLGLPRTEVSSKDPTTAAAVKGFVKRTYSTTINEADPELLLSWVAQSSDGAKFPGLEIDSMRLTPGRTSETGRVVWNLDITFRRWERQQ